MPSVFITVVLLFKIKPHLGLKLQENQNREGRKAIFSMCLYFVFRAVAWVNAVDPKSVNIVKHGRLQNREVENPSKRQLSLEGKSSLYPLSFLSRQSAITNRLSGCYTMLWSYSLKSLTEQNLMLGYRQSFSIPIEDY